MSKLPLFVRDSAVVAALTMCFVVLKLAGLVVWSWWWVLSPIWIVTVIVVAVIVLTVLITGWFGGDRDGDSHEY